MEIKLFSLCKQEVAQSEQGKKCIVDCVAQFFPDAEDFAAFSSQKRMLLAISQSLRAADVVVVAVQKNMYNATKKLLCSAIGVKLIENEEVREILFEKLNTGTINQATFDANIMYPADAQILPTTSGINCGFTLTAGGQHIIYIPIEAPMAEEVVFGNLYDYFAEIVDGDCIDTAMNFRHKQIIDRTVDKLNGNNIKAIIHCEKFGSNISSYIEGRKLNAGIIFDDEIPNCENENFDDFYITTARDLRDRHFAQYGIIFSKPYTDSETDKLFTLVTIADENGTNSFKIFAEDGEDEQALFNVTADKIMLMLYDYNEIINSYDCSVVREDDKALRKALTRLTAAVVGASTIIGIIVAIFIK